MGNNILLFLSVSLFLTFMLVINGCSETEEEDKNYMYTVTRIDQPIEINAEWNKEPWNNIPSIRLDNHIREEPEPRPEVHVKVSYDDEALYVIFHVQDQYVRCVVEEYFGPVWTDSCVEFFFTPNTDLSEGYFNLETNCIGTALFAFQKERGVGRVDIPESTFKKVKLAHSIPSVVEPEITEPVTWTIEYRLPVEILTKYSDVTQPASGVEWRANFYKIADKTSHPHYLSWALIEHPEPHFHLPEYFGTIVFE
ncbi:Carbohydrate-binding family 9 [Fodinibius roseus]|uniref:Carbohydrate-binding family 9 n=1 Tax=Fodinibius roseus TaxID=1194090 RepID=A0A1M5KSB4_9BACT|nr:carbohydrate-binding family 9-like protein [Fodinibius roseus]SHG55752.1 Carbohydrate-binding family 9 [Fodinibius roseus]